MNKKTLLLESHFLFRSKEDSGFSVHAQDKFSFIQIQEIFSFLRCHVNVLPDPTHHIFTGVSVLTQNLTLRVRDPPMSLLALLSA